MSNINSPFDISNSFSSSFPPRLFSCLGNYYAFSANGFYVKESTASIWKRIETPFQLLDGMSATVCGKIIVFYGGIKSNKTRVNTNIFKNRARRADIEQSFSISSSSSNSKSSQINSSNTHSLDYTDSSTDLRFNIPHKKMLFSNEMWIYDNGTWIPVCNDLEPTAYHSACYIPSSNSICFVGGCKYKRSPNKKTDQLIDSEMFPQALNAIESYELINKIAIFSLDKFVKTSFEPTFKGNVLNMQSSYPTKQDNIPSRNLPLGSTVCYKNDEKIIIFGGKHENGDNSNFLYVCDISKRNFYEYELPIVPIDKFLGDSFIDDNMLFVFSGFSNNTFSNSCWIFDFDHSTWIFYNISKLLQNAAFLLPSSKGALIFNKQLTNSIEINFKDDIVTFLSKIIDEDNINSNLYNTDTVTEYCSNIFKSCVDNFSSLVNKVAADSSSEQKSETSSDKKSKKSNEFSPLIEMIKEFNNLQFSCFKLDERLNLLEKSSDSIEQQNESNQTPKAVPDISEAKRLLEEFNKLEANNEKFRNEQLNKSKELAASLDLKTELSQNEIITSHTSQRYSILPPFNEKREINSIVELCSEIDEQERLITSLRQKHQDIVNKQIQDKDLITEYYNLDNLALISEELQQNVYQQQIDHASQIINSNKNWIDYMETVSNCPSEKKSNLLKLLRRISYQSKLQNWEKDEKEEYQKMNEKLYSTFKKLKKNYAVPSSEKETARILALQKDVYDSIDAIAQRTEQNLKYPPSETDYWEEVYSNIVRTSTIK